MTPGAAGLARGALLLAVWLVAVPCAAAPDWLVRSLRVPLPAEADVHAHVLLLEQSVSLVTPGRSVTRERGVVRILDARGASSARTALYFDQSSATVRSFHVWLFDGRRSREWKRSDAVDRSLTSDVQLRADLRALEVVADEASPGAVFAWEWVVDEKPLLAEQAFWFGADRPCARQVFELQLANGLEPRTVFSQGVVPAPTREGDTWRWERQDLPAWPDEPGAASFRTWADRVVVAPSPPDGRWGASFPDWRDVGRWLAALSAPSLAPTPEIERKARELAGAEAGPLERARRLAGYAQSVNYVAVSVGLARGEGYRPRPAATVLGTGYGDCKDKAALFCALARSLGMQAWLVAAKARGRDAVRADWPTPVQFDHCIAALSVPPGSGLECTVEDPALGPLVLFDPTDPEVPFGAVPASLAGSSVLLEHAEHPRLLTVPEPAPERDLRTSLLQGALDSLGTLTATWTLTVRGERAWSERAQRAASPADWQERHDRALGEWLGACRVSRRSIEDHAGSDSMRIVTELVASRYARPLGGRLMACRTPARRVPLASASADSTRRTPLSLWAEATDEQVVLRLPAGWRMVEAPPALSTGGDFGSLEASWRSAGDSLRFMCRTRLRPVTWPAERHAEWRSFTRDWTKVSRAQVVLERP